MATVVEGKVPKAIMAVREKLQNLGLDITVDNLKAHLTAKGMNLAQGCLRSSLKHDPSKAEQYGEMNRKDQKDWLVAFALDPDISKLSCTHITTKELVRRESGRIVWLTEEPMASDTWFASSQHAKIIVDSPLTKSQLIIVPALKEADVKAYKVEVAEEMWQKNTNSAVELKARADITAYVYANVKTAMESESPPDMKRRTKQTTSISLPTLVDMTPEERALCETQEKEREEKRNISGTYRAALATMKRGCDKVRKEMDATLNRPHALEAKGSPNDMEAYYSDAIVPCMSTANAVLDEWGTWAKSDVLTGPTEKLEETIKTVETRTKELDDKHTTLEGNIKQLKSISKWSAILWSWSCPPRSLEAARCRRGWVTTIGEPASWQT